MTNRGLINGSVKTDINNSVLCWLATVDEDGMPNVSPKEIFDWLDDNHLVIADIASPVSTKNICSNPKVCVSFVDVFRQRGFKLKGEATVLTADAPQFRQATVRLSAMVGQAFPIRSVILVAVSKVARIVAPSYLIFPDRTEAERMAEAYNAYGVQPILAGSEPSGEPHQTMEHKTER